jgi:hypothetical protein
MYKYLLFYISIIAVADKLSFFFSSVYLNFNYRCLLVFLLFCVKIPFNPFSGSKQDCMSDFFCV